MRTDVAEPSFVPGAELAGAFYREAVGPLVGRWPHAAALLGWGSDVLGYDTARSTDHGWGPRLTVLVNERDVHAAREALDVGLPPTFHGWPVRFGWDAVPVSHHVTVTPLSAWLLEQLGVDASQGMRTLDWLLTPQQRLLGVVAGAVFADQDGELTRVRRALAWYPDDPWRWLLACQWTRIAQEEAFVQRAAEVGDSLGSAVVGARLVRDVMRLALLLARRYRPYDKWLGSAFRELGDDELARHLGDALAASTPERREAALAASYSVVARRHNDTGVTPFVDPATRSFYSRPAQVLMAGRFADACLATVTDPVLARLPLIGAVDQVCDSSDVLSDPSLYRRLSVLYPGLDETPRDG
jgi:hypothetical protein